MLEIVDTLEKMGLDETQPGWDWEIGLLAQGAVENSPARRYWLFIYSDNRTVVK